MSTRVLSGKPLVVGAAAAEALVANEPLSFWGGYDAATGSIIDRRHPLFGQVAAGRVLAVPFSRGSSTTTAVLLEAIRAGSAPAAIVTTSRDTFFALASFVALELYNRSVPVIVLVPEDFAQLATGDHVAIEEGGCVRVSR